MPGWPSPDPAECGRLKGSEEVSLTHSLTLLAPPHRWRGKRLSTLVTRVTLGFLMGLLFIVFDSLTLTIFLSAFLFIQSFFVFAFHFFLFPFVINFSCGCTSFNFSSQNFLCMLSLFLSWDSKFSDYFLSDWLQRLNTQTARALIFVLVDLPLDS